MKWVYYQTFATEANNKYPNILIIILQLVKQSVTSANVSRLSTVQFMHIYRTASVMLWILFKIFFN